MLTVVPPLCQQGLSGLRGPAFISTLGPRDEVRRNATHRGRLEVAREYLEPLEHRICWAHDPAEPMSGGLAAFSFDVGLLFMHGPAPQDVFCFLEDTMTVRIL